MKWKPLVIWGGIAIGSLIVGAVALSIFAGEFLQNQRQANALYRDYEKWYLKAPAHAIDADRATTQAQQGSCG